MAKFSKTNFIKIVKEIEKMEAADENYWVPIGILEVMYEDDYGNIDHYFHSPIETRNVENLWDELMRRILFTDRMV